MPDREDADDDAADAAAIKCRVGVVATSSIVSRGPRVRFSYAAPRGDGSSGNTSGLHPEIPGSNPGRSTGDVKINPLSVLNQLWRPYTIFASYRLRPGGTAGLQNLRAEFNSLASCHSFTHRVVVIPTQSLRTEAHCHAPG